MPCFVISLHNPGAKVFCSSPQQPELQLAMVMLCLEGTSVQSTHYVRTHGQKITVGLRNYCHLMVVVMAVLKSSCVTHVWNHDVDVGKPLSWLLM